MEDIAHMVSASLARHGFTARIDHRRLQWSRWCRCESSLSVLLTPSKPGLFALAEEINIRGESVLELAKDEKRLLTVFRISESEDLGMALGRLFLPSALERDRFSTTQCYVRYAVIEDDDQRHASYRSLQEWMASSPESSSEIPNNLPAHSFDRSENGEDQNGEDQGAGDAGNGFSLARTGT